LLVVGARQQHRSRRDSLAPTPQHSTDHAARQRTPLAARLARNVHKVHLPVVGEDALRVYLEILQWPKLSAESEGTRGDDKGAFPSHHGAEHPDCVRAAHSWHIRTARRRHFAG
jgi:hypothetical protein